MLFGIGVTDALTFAAAPLGMMLVVLLATLRSRAAGDAHFAGGRPALRIT